LGGLGLLEALAQELDSVAECAALDQHDEVDGVEVALAVETACEIGSRVGGAVEALTAGALESECPFTSLVWQTEDVADEIRDVHVVSELVEERLRVSVRHDVQVRAAEIRS
jgi:hypothetical protein